LASGEFLDIGRKREGKGVALWKCRFEAGLFRDGRFLQKTGLLRGGVSQSHAGKTIT